MFSCFSSQQLTVSTVNPVSAQKDVVVVLLDVALEPPTLATRIRTTLVVVVVR